MITHSLILIFKNLNKPEDILIPLRTSKSLYIIDTYYLSWLSHIHNYMDNTTNHNEEELFVQELKKDISKISTDIYASHIGYHLHNFKKITTFE